MIEDKDLRKRVQKEVEIHSQLKHPSIIEVCMCYDMRPCCVERLSSYFCVSLFANNYR